MKYLLILLTAFAVMICSSATCAKENTQMIVRIAKVKVDPKYLDSYLEFVKENGKASVEKEAGVISLFPMQDKSEPTDFSIVEIYRDEAAYQHHIKTEHFQKYKQGTLKMVTDLKLVDMTLPSPELLPLLFKKYETVSQ